jgi:non-canonical purine NTP pyrophosphatase (RdgB/HAM1 family)
MSKKPIFVTGNQNKADYLSKLLGITLKHQKIDLDEIQSIDLRTVVEHKVKQAFAIIKAPVLVEDTSLSFVALNGLPGTFIKFFVDEVGLEATCRILDGFSDRTAVARTGYGYYDGTKFTYIEGSHTGLISQSPGTGNRGFGWDRIFIPDGYGGKNRSDLSEPEYDELYLKIKPAGKLREFLTSN